MLRRIQPTPQLPESFSRIEKLSLSDNPQVMYGWSAMLPSGYNFLSDRFWRVMDDPNSSIAQAIGILMLGVKTTYPDFIHTANMTASGTYVDQNRRPHPTGLITIVGRTDVEFRDPEHTVSTLMLLTSRHLRALNPGLELEFGK